MRIVFTKISDLMHGLDIVRDDGTREHAELVSRSFLRHDLLHHAVEAEAGITDGVWGSLAAGKTFADLNDRTGEAMKDHAGAVGFAEIVTGVLTGVVKGRATPEGAVAVLRDLLDLQGRPLPAWLNAGFVAAVEERMRRLLGRWKGVPYRQSMELSWPPG